MTLEEANSRTAEYSTTFPHETDQEIPELVQAEAQTNEPSAPVERRSHKSPVTFITGYLGSGKTTLLQHLLNNRKGKRIAVILNDVGEETGLEKSLMIDENGNMFEDWQELPNGCVCCSVRDSLVATVEALVERSNFDFIVIETAGLADPSKVAPLFWVDDNLESLLYLDGIVAVVDTKHIYKHLTEKSSESGDNVAQRQIGIADVILTNKIDLVSEDEYSRALSEIRSINSMATILPATRADVPFEDILGIKSLDTVDLAQFSASEAFVNTLDDSCEAKCGTNCSGSHPPHDSLNSAVSHSGHHLSSLQPVVSAAPHSKASVRTINFRTPPVASLYALEYWLGEYLWKDQRYEDFYRFKGVIAVDGHPSRYVLQGVHELFDIQETTEWSSEEEKICRFLFVGRGLDSEILRESFIASCCTSPGTP